MAAREVRGTHRLRAAIMASSALFVPLLNPAAPVAAADATWLLTPGSNEYALGSNWSTGAVPNTGSTAFFGTSNTTNLSLGGNTTVGGWTFNAGASNYTFTTNNRSLTFDGAGIVVNGGSIDITNTASGTIIFGGGAGVTTAGTASITNNGSLQFFQNGTAGNATIQNESDITSGITFEGGSTAGNATITNGLNGSNGFIFFKAGSTAGDANFINNAGVIDFAGDSTAGTTSIIGGIGSGGGFVTLHDDATLDQAEVSIEFGGAIEFFDTSGAGSATITTESDGANFIRFFGDSDAENSTITNSGVLEFHDNSTAGNSAITTNSGSQILFYDNSTAGAASIDNDDGTVDFSGSSGPAGDGKLSAGSIAGSGEFYLGAGELTVGGNNNSTTVSGIISDCGPEGDNCTASGAAGGSLVKTGTGTLTLSGTNTYTGATTVNGGSLIVNGDQTAATGLTSVNSGGTLGGTGIIGGNVTVADDGTLAPGGAGGGVGNLTIAGNLSLADGATLNYSLGAADVVGGSLNDLVTVNGDLVLDGTINVSETSGGTFGPGVYRIINYTGELTDNGLVVGTAPVSGVIVQTAIDGQVNLVNSQGLSLSFWDGDAGPATNGTIDGGDGTWQASGDDNWTNATGSVNGEYGDGSFAVFAGTFGTVTVAAGGVSASGMQFATGGYVIQGGAIALVGSQSIIRVGDGTPAGAAYVATISSNLTGDGSQLVKTDLGTLILSGTNTYTGGTAINLGVLQVSSDGNLGAATGGLVFDGGTLRNTAGFSSARGVTLNANGGTFETNAHLTLSGVIGGTGALTKTGASELILTGNNTYGGGTTISAGTLQLGNGGSTGSVTGNIENNATLIFNRSDSYVFNGVISGTGVVHQIGAGGTGTLTLNGQNTYSGLTTVAAGTLIIGDNAHASAGVAGDVLVNSGARLGGIGTIGGDVDVSSGATIAAGNGIGTLTIEGNYTQAAGSTYEAEIEPGGTSDLIRVTGTANIAGDVSPITAPGAYVADTRYTILTATGGVIGTYDALDQSNLFVDLELAYDLNNVYLDVIRNSVAFCDVAATRNQCATGEAAEDLGPGNPIYDAITGLSDEESARQAFDALSGEIHASVKSALFTDSHFIRDAVFGRLRTAFRPDDSEAFGLMVHGADAVDAPVEVGGVSLWTRGYGAWGSFDGDGNAAKLDTETGGFFVGGDAPLGDWRLGLLAGYGNSTFKADDRSSKADLDTYTLGAYAGTSLANLGPGDFGLRFGAAYSWHDIDTRRSIVFPGFDDTAKASYDAATAQLFAELGYRFDAGTAAFEPFANLAYVNLDSDGYGESGVAGLEADSDDSDITYTTLGLRASTTFDLGAMQAGLNGTVGWQHAFGDTDSFTTHAFAGGTPFTVAGVPVAEDAALIEAGLDMALTSEVTLGVSYQGQFGSDTEQNGVNASLNVKF